MKKLGTVLCTALLLIFGTHHALATKTITFQVHMGIQVQLSTDLFNPITFNPVTDSVILRGDFEHFVGETDWSGESFLLAKSNTNDSLYSISIDFPDSIAGKMVQYKFVVRSYGTDIWEYMVDNRSYTATTDSLQTLPLVYFDDLIPAAIETHTITFQANLDSLMLEGFDPTADSIVVNSNFNYNNQTVMTRVGTTSIYQYGVSITRPKGELVDYNFRVFPGATFSNGGYESSYDRAFLFPSQDTTLAAIRPTIFGTVQHTITFQANVDSLILEGFDPATDSLVVDGDFNNWDSHTAMTRVGTTAIYQYSVTMSRIIGDEVQYKFRAFPTSKYFNQGWDLLSSDYLLNRAFLFPNQDSTFSAIRPAIHVPISLLVDSIAAHRGDTIDISIHATFPQNKSYSSSEITLAGYQGGLQFLGVDTSSTLIGSQGWLYQVNGNDSVVITASAGAYDIGGGGVLFKARFKVLDNAAEFIPITIQHAMFNAGTDSVVTMNGGVNVMIIPVYGDVDQNGQIQAADAAVILKYLVGIDSLDIQSLANADATNNGFVSALDATAILKYVVHLVNSLPADSSTMGPLTAQGVIAMNSSISSPLGSVVEVPLNLSQGNNILSFEGKIKFDPNDLSWRSIAWSPLLSSFNIVVAVDSTAGTIRFAGAGSLPDGNEGKFASLFFLSKKDGKSAVALQDLRWNEGQKATNVSSTNIVTSVEQNKLKIPTEFLISQNYPNPFNPSTAIRYGLPQRSMVTIEVFNSLGQTVKVLASGVEDVGYHEVEWNAYVSSGIYFYRIAAVSLSDPAKSFIDVKKMLLLK